MQEQEKNGSFELSRVYDVFSDFNAQLAVIKDENEKTVFDYESKEGNKAARSLIRKLGSSKTAIAEAHKGAKAEALEFGRSLDSEKKRLTAVIDEMIMVHKEPIKAIEEREAQRKALIENNIQSIKDCLEMVFETSDIARAKYVEIKAIVIDENSFGEFIEPAELAKYKALESIEEKGKLLKEQEDEKMAAEQAEKDRLEKERVEAEKKAESDRIEAEKKAKKEQEEREARIAQEAKAQAEREVQEQIEQAKRDKVTAELKIKEEKERAKRDQKAALAKAEQDKKDAIAKVEREANDKAEAEQKRVADEKAKAEQERKAAEQKEAKRQANRAHQGRINKAIMAELVNLGCDEALGKKIVTKIAKQEIANIQINY